jgi:hypothetical protein
MKFKYLLLLLTIYASSCSEIKQNSLYTATDYKKMYQNAIENSIYPKQSKVSDNLISINDKNQELIRKDIKGEEHILFLAWKDKQVVDDFYKPKLNTALNTGIYPIWVTSSNELKDWFKKNQVKDTVMRLKQLLGLPPTATNSHFVEFWVKQKNLFRPCPDKEIIDNRCNCNFLDNVDEDHKKWINENRVSRYYNMDLYNQYPWTQLGYTYDWSAKNVSHIGLSEFIIDQNAIVYIKKIYTTSQYLHSK